MGGSGLGNAANMDGQMSFAEFERSAREDAAPPAALPPPLLALWREARGDWEAAHALAQEAGDRDGAWVHAYLHRKEGDAGNAAYWYARAGRPVARSSLPDEWAAIARDLLAR